MFVPVLIAMPPGLNTIDDAPVLLAADAPPRPVTRASCSLMLNAFACAVPLNAMRASVVRRVVMAGSLVNREERERVGLHLAGCKCAVAARSGCRVALHGGR